MLNELSTTEAEDPQTIVLFLLPANRLDERVALTSTSLRLSLSSVFSFLIFALASETVTTLFSGVMILALIGLIDNIVPSIFSDSISSSSATSNPSDVVGICSSSGTEPSSS